jgi:hypothetical protein
MKYFLLSKKNISVFILLLMAFQFSYSQNIKLKQSIGIDSLPSDKDSICQFPFAPDLTFNSYGYNAGDTIPDFTLYTKDGKAVNIKSELEKGKPVLLVSGSYTCPIFRRKTGNLNQFNTDFGNRITPFIIYVVEAHPITDVSPYTESPGSVWVTADNENEGVLRRQPKTYGERRMIVQEVLNNKVIIPQILIDGPCNNWWTHFGPGAVLAYLINTDGVIIARESWYNGKGKNLNRDLRNFLSKTTDFDKTTIFTYKQDENKKTALLGGSTLELTAEIKNTSNSEMFIDIKIVKQNTPIGWMVNMSAEKALPIDMDSVVMYLAPKETKEFKLVFKTAPTAGKGDVTLKFQNSFNPENSYELQFFGETDSTFTDVPQSGNSEFSNIEINPNPLSDYGIININSNKEEFTTIEIFDILGNKIQSMNLGLIPKVYNMTFDGKTMQNGMYYCRMITPTMSKTIKFFLYK